MSGFLLAVRAEVLMGVLLVARHRTTRLAGLLAIAIVASSLIASSVGETGGSGVWVSLVVAGSLAAVAASRLLAPGASLAAGYRAASYWWLVPSARLIGGIAATLPVLLAVMLIVAASSLTPARVAWLSVVTVGYAASGAALVMAVTPVMGASGAAAAGFIFAWFGTVPPSGVSALVERWPLVQGPLVFLWNTLPLGWRAIRWFEHANPWDPALIAAWLPIAVCASAWTMTVCYRSQHPHPGWSL